MTSRPAPILREPASAPGVTFLEAACRLCVWPISGAGADMVVCGQKRVQGLSYCDEHRRSSSARLRVLLD